jgi:hypothetical protein
MKRKTSYVRKITVEPYNWCVFVFDHKQKWLRFVLRRMIGSAKVLKQDLDEARGITISNRMLGEAYIGVFDGAGHTLVHEVVHAAVDILGDVGVKTRPDDSEALAYMVEHIVKECSG